MGEIQPANREAEQIARMLDRPETVNQAATLLSREFSQHPGFAAAVANDVVNIQHNGTHRNPAAVVTEAQTRDQFGRPVEGVFISGQGINRQVGAIAESAPPYYPPAQPGYPGYQQPGPAQGFGIAVPGVTVYTAFPPSLSIGIGGGGGQGRPLRRR